MRGDHRDDTPLAPRGLGADTDEPGAGERAPHDARMELARAVDVGDEAAAPGDELEVSRPPDARADRGHAATAARTSQRASRTTAATRSRLVFASIARSETASQDAGRDARRLLDLIVSEPPAPQDLGRLVQDPRHRLDRADHDPGSAHRAAVSDSDEDACRCECEVAGADCELPETGVAELGRGCDSYGDDHLVRLERRREGPEQEVAHLDLAFPAARLPHDACIESERCHGQLGRRVPVRQAAAERSTCTDREVSDVPRGEREQAMTTLKIRLLEPSVSDERTELELAVTFSKGTEPFQGIDVDDVRGFEQPKGEHRQQALPAGEQLRLVPRL